MSSLQLLQDLYYQYLAFSFWISIKSCQNKHIASTSKLDSTHYRRYFKRFFWTFRILRHPLNFYYSSLLGGGLFYCFLYRKSISLAGPICPIISQYWGIHKRHWFVYSNRTNIIWLAIIPMCHPNKITFFRKGNMEAPYYLYLANSTILGFYHISDKFKPINFL